MSLLASLQSFLDPWLLFLSEDPLLRGVQVALLLVGALVIFLVFYTTRDMLLRTHSFWYMLFCIVLVAAFPGVGFLLYLLIRPPRTVKEREVEHMVRGLWEEQQKRRSGQQGKGGKDGRREDVAKR
ncbi:MAG: hypothetical protein PHI23_05080 [Candidatus Peribacteraceae bacterium]|nr:hypothetical protein [Candidatus Peribacteraceae bacterium]